MIEITDLPRPGYAPSDYSPQRLRGYRGMVAGPATAAASAIPAADSIPTWTPTTATASSSNAVTPSRASLPESQGTFGYQSDYQWLRGQLEYSETARRWKLRYIPRDASERKMDDFGGSVVLAGLELLCDYAPGEFVTVRGRLGDRKSGAVDFAPVYHLNQVTRQGTS